MSSPIQASRNMLLAVFAMVLVVGCQSDVMQPSGEPTVQVQAPVRQHGGSLDGDRVVPMNCSTNSGLLLPLLGLTLNTNSSSVTYPIGTVNLGLTVSFGVCTTDSSVLEGGKVQVLGPFLELLFLARPFVNLSLEDAGLPLATPDNSPFQVFRKNEATGIWEFVAGGIVSLGRVRYEVLRNGTYLVSLLRIPVLDTLWTTTRFILPEVGGSLELLNSLLVVDPGALEIPTTISWTIAARVPVGLNGALPREYEFGPDGTTFRSPVTAYVAFDDAGLESNDPYLYQFYYFEPLSQTWIVQPSKVDLTNQRFVFQLGHFSRYAFGR
jgi:hypothetical protein